MPSGFAPLATVRLTSLIQQIESVNDAAPRLWTSRIPRVNRADEDILAKLTGSVIAADIISDDSKAVIRSFGSFEYSTNEVISYKHGAMFSATKLRELRRIERNLATVGERGMFEDFIAYTQQNLLDGIRDRIELILCQMLIDDGDYDRLGIKMSNISWGMPAAMKSTPGVPWSTAATATPVAAARSTGSPCPRRLWTTLWLPRNSPTL
jgi:hypothetical protein